MSYDKGTSKKPQVLCINKPILCQEQILLFSGNNFITSEGQNNKNNGKLKIINRILHYGALVVREHQWLGLAMFLF